MSQSTSDNIPGRVSDLIELKKSGVDLTCRPEFEIVPVDFRHRDSQFQAYIFLCRYKGTMGDTEYSFRKCYARGCPHNLCPHVSQAVMIANRYLQRDYRRLKQGGVEVEERLFRLEDMIVKYEDLREEQGHLLAIHDYINIAKEGNEVSIDVLLEYVDAVEHFANEKNPQTFLNGDFRITTLGHSGDYQRCLGCYSTEREDEEKENAVKVANTRLKLLYDEFENASIKFSRNYFS